MGIKGVALDPQNIDKLLDIKLLQDKGFEFAIVYNYDSVEVSTIEEKNLKLEKDNIIEAKFFSKDKELTIVREEDFDKIFYFEETDNNFILEETRELKNRKYKAMVVKKYFDIDDDGQVYLKHLKPTSLIKREN